MDCPLLQDSLRRLSCLEDELVELRNSLHRDKVQIRNSLHHKVQIRRASAKQQQHGKDSGGDSGISDSYDVYEAELPAREEKLARLKVSNLFFTNFHYKNEFLDPSKKNLSACASCLFSYQK